MAGSTRRYTRRHSQQSRLKRDQHSENGPGRQRRIGRDEDTRHRRRSSSDNDSGTSSGSNAARLRQNDGQRSRRCVHAGATKRIPDDIPSEWKPVHRRRRQRWELFRRVYCVPPALGCSMKTTENRLATKRHKKHIRGKVVVFFPLCAFCAFLWLIPFVTGQDNSRTIWDGVYSETQAKRGEDNLRGCMFELPWPDSGGRGHDAAADRRGFPGELGWTIPG